MAAAIALASLRWCKDLLRNLLMWPMLALPAAISLAVAHASPSGAQTFDAIWLVFAQLMTGLMISSGHWLEERAQGTYDVMRASPLPVGWLLFAQGGIVALLALLSQLLVFALNHGAIAWNWPLGLGMLADAVLFSALGVLIGVSAPSARAGNMVATVVMMALFLGAIVAPGVEKGSALHAAIGWLPSVVASSSLDAAMASGHLPAGAELAQLAWLAAVLVGMFLALRRQYVQGA